MLVVRGKIQIDIFLEFRLIYSATALKMVNYPPPVWILNTKSLLIENVNLILSNDAETEIFPEIIFQNYFVLNVTVIKKTDFTQVTWANTVIFIPNWYYTTFCKLRFLACKDPFFKKCLVCKRQSMFGTSYFRTAVTSAPSCGLRNQPKFLCRRSFTRVCKLIKYLAAKS